MYQNGFRSQMRLVAVGATGVLVAALSGSSALADTAKCLQTISKSTAKYEIAVQKALGKCEDAHAKDATKTPSCPDAKATDKINGALTKMQDKINGDCTGETIAGLGFGGLIHQCSAGERVGEFCVKNGDCNGSCDTGGQIGEPCNSNSSCAGACSLNGIEIREDGQPKGPMDAPVSCKGNGTTQCQNRKGCTGDITVTCSIDADCNPSPGGTCVSGSCSAFPGHCANAGTCDPADGCPNLINKSAPFGDCTAPLASVSDLEACLACNSNSVADAVTGFAWDGRRAPFTAPAFGLPDDGDKGKAVLACQRSIGKAVDKYFQKVRKATQKCTADLLKAKVTSCPDSKLSGKITDAQTALSASISGDCAGDLFNKTVVEPDALKHLLDHEPLADPLTPLPNSGPAFNAIAQSLLGTLMTCSDDFGAGLPAMGLPACAQLTSNCGNGQIDTGEDCDDGNVVNGDTCPSNCLLNTACSVTGTVTVTFNVTSPVNPLGALTGYLSYDNTKVNLPGSGAGAGGSITTGAFGVSVNDLDSSVRVALSDPADIGTPPFSFTFNVCSGASVSAGDFDCLVEGAGDPATAANVAGVTCNVTVM